MDPAPARNARRVHWVSSSQGEAESGLPFMMAICRPNGIVYWLLQPVTNLMDPKKTRNLSIFSGRKLYRTGKFQEIWVIRRLSVVDRITKSCTEATKKAYSSRGEPFNLLGSIFRAVLLCFFRRLARTLIVLGEILLRCSPADCRRSSPRLVS